MVYGIVFPTYKSTKEVDRRRCHRHRPNTKIEERSTKVFLAFGQGEGHQDFGHQGTKINSYGRLLTSY
jgi:hypothetical protein